MFNMNKCMQKYFHKRAVGSKTFYIQNEAIFAVTERGETTYKEFFRELLNDIAEMQKHKYKKQYNTNRRDNLKDR